MSIRVWITLLFTGIDSLSSVRWDQTYAMNTLNYTYGTITIDSAITSRPTPSLK